MYIISQEKKTLIHHRQGNNALANNNNYITPCAFCYLFSAQCNYNNIIVNLICTPLDFLYSRTQEITSAALIKNKYIRMHAPIEPRSSPLIYCYFYINVIVCVRVYIMQLDIQINLHVEYAN